MFMMSILPKQEKTFIDKANRQGQSLTRIYNWLRKNETFAAPQLLCLRLIVYKI